MATRAEFPTRLCVAVTEGHLPQSVHSMKEVTLYYIGIDVAKHLHVATIKNSDGEQIGKALEFNNNSDGFNSLLKHLKQNNVLAGQCIAVMESTGHYWMSLHEFLANHEIPVAVINPLRTDSFRNVESIRKTKNDRLDASLIAEYARFAKLQPASFSTELSAKLKILTRHRSDTIKQRTMVKNKVTAECDKVFPELAQIIGGVSCKAARAVMKEFSTPKVVAKTDIRTLTKTLKSASQGRFGRKHALQLKEAAKNSVGTTFGVDASAFVLEEMVDSLDYFDTKIKKIEGEITTLIKGTCVEHLLTIPGVGETSASAIASEIGRPENFENARKLVAYAGLDPTKKQSGGFESTKNHISKRGSSYLRHALITSANVARMYDPYFGDYYDSMRARGKHHLVALTAVARKLAGVILVVMKEQRDYIYKPSIQSQKMKVVSTC